MNARCKFDAPADWPKAGDAIPPQIYGPFSAGQMLKYVIASGDDNPLHFDPMLAAKMGLPLPPVHGMLMLSCFEPAILAWRHDVAVAKLSAKFLRPLLTGQSLTISGRILRVSLEPGPQLLLRLIARAMNEIPASGPNRDLVVMAEAALHYRPGPA